MLKYFCYIEDEQAHYFRCDKCGEVVYRRIGDMLGGKIDVTIGGTAIIKNACAWRNCPYCGSPFYEEDKR